MKIRIKNIFLVATSEYFKWLFNPKIILVFALLVPIRELIVIPMLKAAEEMNQPINIFECMYCCYEFRNNYFVVAVNIYSANIFVSYS